MHFYIGIEAALLFYLFDPYPTHYALCCVPYTMQGCVYLRGDVGVHKYHLLWFL